MNKKKILIFLGPPGSGKGTQADMLGEALGFPVISPGELLRHEINKKTEIGQEVEKYLSKGALVSDDIIEQIVDKRLKKSDVKNGFFLDGYPRRMKQLKFLIKRLKEITVAEDFVYAVFIEVSDAEVKRRLGGRRVCDCGASFHLKYNPPKKRGICDLCGSKLMVRKDDNPDTIKKRLKLYHKKIRPIVDYWHKNDKLIRINGDQAINNIQKEIVRILKKKKII